MAAALPVSSENIFTEVRKFILRTLGYHAPRDGYLTSVMSTLPTEHVVTIITRSAMATMCLVFFPRRSNKTSCRLPLATFVRGVPGWTWPGALAMLAVHQPPVRAACDDIGRRRYARESPLLEVHAAALADFREPLGSQV